MNKGSYPQSFNTKAIKSERNVLLYNSQDRTKCIDFDDKQNLKMLLEESGIYANNETIAMFYNANATYKNLINAIQTWNQSYIDIVQNIWSLGDDEVAQLSYCIKKRIGIIDSQMIGNYYSISFFKRFAKQI